MRGKIIPTICLSVFGFWTVWPIEPVWAAQQKYKRYYQKKTAVFQEKKQPYYQPKDKRSSTAYLEVNRLMPQVSVDYQPQETAYVIERPKIPCRGTETLSCTSFAVDFKVDVDCETSKILMKVEEKKRMTVELSSLYPKGSCQFDLILKHELSHVDVYKNTLSGFIMQAERDLKAQYKEGQQKSKGCKEIKKMIADLADGLASRYAEKERSANVALDQEREGHLYGLEACAQQESK